MLSKSGEGKPNSGFDSGESRIHAGDVVQRSQGNNIRIIDAIRGPNFYKYLDSLDMEHEAYFHDAFPDILVHLIGAFEAIQLLHENGFRHGDIRNDHILIERSTGS